MMTALKLLLAVLPVVLACAAVAQDKPLAGHFYERGFGGYLFDEVLAVTVPWFDTTLKGAKAN